MTIIHPYAFAEAKQAWHEQVAAALKDEREELCKKYLATERRERDNEDFDLKLRGIDARIEQNRQTLQNHREEMRLVKAYDERCRQRAGWP